MLSGIAQNIAHFFVKTGFIKESDVEIYAYGYEILISEIINWTITIVIAILTKRVAETIFYTIAFMHLRESIGGFHAKTHLRCTILSALVFIICLWFIYITPESIYSILIVGGVALHMFLVLWLAPVAHPNKPFTDKREISKFRSKSIKLSIFYSVLCIALLLLPWKPGKVLSYSVLLGMISASLSMFYEHVRQNIHSKEGREHNEEFEEGIV